MRTYHKNIITNTIAPAGVIRPVNFMMIEERLTTYLHSLERGNDDFLEALRAYAESSGVPIIRREMESFLAVLLKLSSPAHILEIGTGIGYSAIFMAKHSQAKIVTIESYEKRIVIAREKIAQFHSCFNTERCSDRKQKSSQNKTVEEPPLFQNDSERYSCMEKPEADNRIFLIEGDAAAILPMMEGAFDFIFLDAAKAQYIEMLPDLLRLLTPGGVLLADNVLQGGRLIDSRFVTERRQRTIHERMREFLWTVKHHPQLTTSVITIGDGVSLSVKNKTPAQG